MSWHFGWVATKRDDRGKRHMYGRIERNGRIFVVYGVISGKPYIHLNERFLYYEYASTGKHTKIREGYKVHEPEDFVKSFPGIIDEINAQFLIKKLKNG